MANLTFKDFELAVTIGENRALYYSFTFKDYEICLEKCLNGFNVAIYKVGPDERICDLVEPKKCTNFNFGEKLTKGQQNMILLRALKFANQFYKKYNN